MQNLPMEVRRNEVPQKRKGWLKHGNPPGDPSTAPRCGAKAKSTGLPCRAPAIRGRKRCRMHGGNSRGPTTPEGLERCRTARLVHGYYSREQKEERRRNRAETRELIRQMRELSEELEQRHKRGRSDKEDE